MSARKSHIWVGQFGPDAPKNYFSENRDRDEDVDPMNMFAKEQGQLYFDYDFTEISFLDWIKAEIPKKFIEGHSYSESYIEIVAQLCDERKIDRINVFVIANEDQFRKPKTVLGAGYRLEYLWAFTCEDY